MENTITIPLKEFIDLREAKENLEDLQYYFGKEKFKEVLETAKNECYLPF